MIRIGELAKRSGVSTELIRAWERRYRLLEPTRSDGGFRLYDDAAVVRLRRMRELMANGMSAAQAAFAAREGPGPGRGPLATVPAELSADLERALAELNEDAAHQAIDRLLGAVTVETFLSDVALPMLRGIGDRWREARTTVGHEHFATTLIRGRLLGLARGWDRGSARRAALACMPGELHDVGLIAFGIALSRTGWRILYFGQDTPLASLREHATQAQASLVVLSAVETAHFQQNLPDLRKLARVVPVAIGGAGANEVLASAIHARLLASDLVTAARSLSDVS